MITLTPALLGRLKAQLRAALPQITSCHASEALAAGLGFHKHASLLAALREQEEFQVDLDVVVLAARIGRLGYRLCDADMSKVMTLASEPTSLVDLAQVRGIVYELVARHLRTGISLPHTLEGICRAMPVDGSALEQSVGQCAKVLLERVLSGQRFAEAYSDMAPPLEVMLISAGEMSGNLAISLSRAREISAVSNHSKKACRGIFLRCLSGLMNAANDVHQSLVILSEIGGSAEDGVSEIRSLALRTLQAMDSGADVGKALGANFPPLEWGYFAPMNCYKEQWGEILEKASEAKMADICQE